MIIVVVNILSFAEVLSRPGCPYKRNNLRSTDFKPKPVPFFNGFPEESKGFVIDIISLLFSHTAFTEIVTSPVVLYKPNLIAFPLSVAAALMEASYPCMFHYTGSLS